MGIKFVPLLCVFVTYQLLQDSASAGSASTPFDHAHINKPCRAPLPRCSTGDIACEKDLQAYAAIREIYSHLDDNQDGKVDTAESHDFVLEELKYEDNRKWTERQSSLHGADNVMSVEELWCGWVDGEAHNWTQADLINWLVESVELPQYQQTFERFALDGRALPLLGSAAGSGSRFLTETLGIRIALHRQKLALKAIDVVLFGTPKNMGHALKDFALLVAFCIVVLCTGFVLHQRHYAKQREAAMQRELESLQQAEDTLASMRTRLSEAEQLKQTVLQEKSMLELKLKLRDRATKEQEERLRTRKTSIELYGANSRDVISHLQDEVAQLTSSLRQMEMQIETQQYSASELQFWLQLTYEYELERFNVKKRMAEIQFQQVKESCEKIRKRRNALFGSMRMAHGDILTAVDERIVEARKTLEEVIGDAAERALRWSQIQRACSFEIVNNPGLQALVAQERSRMTTSSNAATTQGASSAPAALMNGSDMTTSQLSVRQLTLGSNLAGSRSCSSSNLSVTGVASIAPATAVRKSEDGGLWLSVPNSSTGRVAGGRREDEEVGGVGLRQRTIDTSVISTDGEASRSSTPSSEHCDNVAAYCAGTGSSSVHFHSQALPRGNTASAIHQIVWPLATTANSQAAIANATALTHASAVYASAHSAPLRHQLHATHTGCAYQYRPALHAGSAFSHLQTTDVAGNCNYVYHQHEQPRVNATSNLNSYRSISTALAPQSGFFSGSFAAPSQLRRAGSHENMHSLRYETADAAGRSNHNSHGFMRHETFDVAEATKMQKELKSLLLEAASAFAKPTHANKKLVRNRTVHGLSALDEQRSTTRLASAASKSNHQNADTIANATAVDRNSPLLDDGDGRLTVCTPRRADCVSVDDGLDSRNLKSFLFRWRAKTRLARLQRHSMDDSTSCATAATAASTIPEVGQPVAACSSSSDRNTNK